MLTFLKRHTETIAWLLIGTGFSIVAIFCGLVYANNLGWGQGVFDIERTGQAGSFVGGTAGALWALAGVLFFKSALMLQRESLNKQIEALDVQREELKLQREELRLQREEMRATRDVFEKQKFEITFFNMFKSKENYAKEAIEISKQTLLQHIINYEKEDLEDSIARSFVNILYCPYIKIIISILIEIRRLRKDEKDRYLRIITSTLDSAEVLIILCSALVNPDLNNELTKSEIQWNYINNDDRGVFAKLNSIEKLRPFLRLSTS